MATDKQITELLTRICTSQFNFGGIPSVMGMEPPVLLLYTAWICQLPASTFSAKAADMDNIPTFETLKATYPLLTDLWHKATGK